MFTGIVRELGNVHSNKNGRLLVQARLGRIPIGGSVAVNGVCLTLARRLGASLEFEMSRETLRRTNLGSLQKRDVVNLEPALKASDFVGGHWVSGHVDSPAAVLEVDRLKGGFLRLRISLPPELRPLVALKGSIAVDGTSLTVTRVGKGYFETVLVPHTIRRTNLGSRRPGDRVNLEADLMARYLMNLLRNGASLREGPCE